MLELKPKESIRKNNRSGETLPVAKKPDKSPSSSWGQDDSDHNDVDDVGAPASVGAPEDCVNASDVPAGNASAPTIRASEDDTPHADGVAVGEASVVKDVSKISQAVTEVAKKAVTSGDVANPRDEGPGEPVAARNRG